MSGVAVAIGGAAIVGAVAAKYASDQQSESSSKAGSIQERQFQTLVNLNKPFRKAGLEALPRLAELSQEDYTETDSFKLQQEEGEEAINRAAAARGGFGSTATVERLGEFNRHLLSSESDKQYGRLLDLVNIGRGATTETGRAATSAGTNLSNLALQEGENRASFYANAGAIPAQTVTAMSNAGVFDRKDGGTN